ncbi:MAG: hypothetical protein Q8P41_01905 [Pseudomonadota bacterium]|nr:hypothetical protein [Pseudomonadota bacterium]
MSDTANRDVRRWAAYERLAADPSASPSERMQARERLVDLRARYPHGRPRPPGERRYAHGAGWARAGGRGDGDEAPREDAAAAHARAEAERVARDEAVRRQRANVERVPGWAASGPLCDLHASRAEWAPEEHQRFKEQRARLTGSTRAVDL